MERDCCPCTNSVIAVPQDTWYSVENFGKYSHITYHSIVGRVEQNGVIVQLKTNESISATAKVTVQFSDRG